MSTPRELWLEFGYVHSDGFHAVSWYNEGRWEELPYFLLGLWKWRKKNDVYFLWRFGRKNHYLRGK